METDDTTVRGAMSRGHAVFLLWICDSVLPEAMAQRPCAGALYIVLPNLTLGLPVALHRRETRLGKLKGLSKVTQLRSAGALEGSASAQL